jgi:hypothetical protein
MENHLNLVLGTSLGPPAGGRRGKKGAKLTYQHQDRGEALALFRYSVIAEAARPSLSPAERGRAVRELASRTWVTPEGTERCFSRTTIDRWLRAYARDGLAGLSRRPRSDRGVARADNGRWLRRRLSSAGRSRPARPARSST